MKWLALIEHVLCPHSVTYGRLTKVSESPLCLQISLMIVLAYRDVRRI